jgi:hypothetical protein
MRIFTQQRRARAHRAETVNRSPKTDARLYARRGRALENFRAGHGAVAIVAAHHTAGRIASGADKAKVEMAAWRRTEDRIFSGHDLPLPKPAPDVLPAAHLAAPTRPAAW